MPRNVYNENWQGETRSIEVVERERDEDRVVLVDRHGKPLRILRSPEPRVGFDHVRSDPRPR